MSIETYPGAREHFAGRRVLVVGGDGFLGRNAVEILTRLGARVTILTRRSPPAGNPTAGVVLTGDMADLDVARTAVAGQDVVLNFVGVTSAVDSNRDPCHSLMQDCFPHLNLLAACADLATPPLVVFPSSRLVYGKPLYRPVDENHPTHPTNIYSVHKLTVENYMAVYRQTKGVPYLIFRISNPYGPHQPVKNKGYGIINQFIQMAVRGETIRIFGDGSQVRDYIFVDELIDMLLRAVMTPACHNQIFNIGGREAMSLRAAAERIVAAAGGTPLVLQPWPKEYQAVETGDYVSAVDKLASFVELPAPIAFEQGLTRTVAAYREAFAAAR